MPQVRQKSNSITFLLKNLICYIFIQRYRNILKPIQVFSGEFLDKLVCVLQIDRLIFSPKYLFTRSIIDLNRFLCSVDFVVYFLIHVNDIKFKFNIILIVQFVSPQIHSTIRYNVHTPAYMHNQSFTDLEHNFSAAYLLKAEAVSL